MMILAGKTCILCSILLFSAINSMTATATATALRREPPLRLTKSTLTRLRQRWASKARQRSSSRHGGNGKSFKQRGTVLTLGKPSKQQLTTWFGSDFGAMAAWSVPMKRQCFNHDMVGMTNPSVNATSKGDLIKMVAACQNPACLEAKDGDVQDNDDDWWPSTAIPENELEALHWNIFRVRQKSVGYGLSCYERIRDAALDWEFATKTQGIAQVHPPETTRGYSIVRPTPFTASDSTQQIWEGPSKRLVTFVRSKFIPKLFAVNPVSVVYNVVDQGAPANAPLTTYTSTAFATLPGHWLQGEERATVVLRHDQSVDVEILSVSQPKTIMGRIVWPFINGMKRDFFERQIHSFETAGRQRNTVQ